MAGADIQSELRVVSELSELVVELKSVEGGTLPDVKDLDSDSFKTHDVARSELFAEVNRIRALRKVRTALIALVQDLEGVIARRRTAIYALACNIGLAELPNEILLHIFKQLMTLGDDPFHSAMPIIRDISLVCKHFREVVLAFTDVWTYIDLDIADTELLDLLASRSRRRPLSVRFTYADDMEQIILQALAHKDRWMHLIINFPWYERKLLNDHPPLVFPFSRWSFPCVVDVELKEGFPTARFFHYDSMRTCKYVSDIGPFSIDGKLQTRLTGFLGPATSLQTLELDVSIFYRPIKQEGQDPHIELPNLTRFSITNQNQNFESRTLRIEPLSTDDIVFIIEALRMPNLRRASVSIMAFFEPDFDLATMMAVAFFRSRRLDSLELNLRWMLKDVDDVLGHVDLPIDGLICDFDLRELSLDAGGCTISFKNKHQISAEDLQSLHIYNCDNDGEGLYDVLRCMKKWRAHPKEIKICSKYVVDEMKLMTLFPKADVGVTSPLTCIQTNHAHAPYFLGSFDSPRRNQ